MNPLPDHRYLHRIAPTPLVPVRIAADAPKIWCKLEYLNPSGSTKDRIARHILEKAWRRNEVGPGTLVVEASSGSTSIALALSAAQMGLRFLAFIPDTATNERALMIQAYGGEVRKVSGGMPEVIRTAAEFAAENDAFLARQFENPDNAEAHQLFTAHEVMAQLPDANIDAVVSGIGTGGTLVGLHRGFTQAGCKTLPVAAIPRCAEGEFTSNVECCSLRFSKDVPGVIDGCSQLFADWRQTDEAQDLIELTVDDNRCMELTHQLWKMGFPVGPSSGLNLGAALAAARDLDDNATIITVFPDRMERYFSHKVFEGVGKA
ncbi:PLP-dependent cysteine synthase family protein [Sulfuriroseicoccus oceanibius]|uniref:Pyridoxal-phosphate dependent enzyme n=1 Tax=Sulfuriroseicoccus oceanibius TaxID=2707525 RepID=A0A6B3LE40_9BACT|nr:pyridoxal-phosphate dependent enzyme [Sulfuriroseicoccus oceanibius]QQL45407.1 pyridoxal-phosphate dependent enzyme [Sulfuriroseicoccus oceanibius]